jgi:MFS transporter, FHS family, glucose/mannose:H+ symporter
MKVAQHSLSGSELHDGNAPAQHSSTALVARLHVGFVLTGIVNTMLGPMLPLLSNRWRLSDLQAGNLFVAQFLGSMVGVTASSLLVAWRGSRPVLVFGLLLMGLGSAALGPLNWTHGLMSLFTLGIGLGLTIPTTNLLISELHPQKRASALSWINLSWGLGAVVCPFIVAALRPSGRSFYLFYGVALLLVLLAATLTQASFFGLPRPQDHGSTRATAEANWKSRYVPILGAIFFLYVGSEASFGGWIASYAKRAIPGETSWVLTSSFFWASLLFGRSIAPALLRRVPEIWLSRISLLVALLGMFTALAARGTIQLGLSTCLAGVGLAPVFPIAIAALSHQFRAMASRVAGLMFNLAGLGGATLPWFVGLTSTRLNSLKAGLFVPLFGCFTMLLLHLFIELQPHTFERSTMLAK